MQIGLQDIRRLGNKKLSEEFFKGDERRSIFMHNLNVLSYKTSLQKMSAFSLPKRYKEFEGIVNSKYLGMKKFLVTVEPLITYDSDVSLIVQRRSRNMWASIWKNFCRDTGCTSIEEKLLTEVGISILFAGTEDSENMSYFRFFNSVILWYLATLHEVDFDKYNLDYIVILDELVLASDVEFNDYIYSLF